MANYVFAWNGGKPVQDELHKEMKEIRSDLDYLKDALKLLLENDKVMLEHIRTNNATGKIANRETATFNFLNEHQR